MNQRIRELAEQCRIEEYSQHGDLIEFGFDEEKFAELIVRECARVYWSIDDGELHTEYVRALKKHFGIKE
jgi:hypothetical protein